ncbi:MAG: hypothetical protein ACI9G1_002207, partial [Pirellulaceae bacterium]
MQGIRIMPKFTSWQLAICLFLSITTVVRSEVTPRQVRDSIRRGVQYLKAQQDPVAGSWPEPSGMFGGVTALATLSLIMSGETKDSPHVKKALRYLESMGQPDTVYVTSLQTMVYAAADPVHYKGLIQRNALWLEQAQISTGDRRGSWGYQMNKGSDNSNAQFALLALHDAEKSGIKVKPRVWENARDYWLAQQRADGSFGYVRDLPSTGSMTCAGLASIIIALDKTAHDAEIRNGHVVCCGNQDETDAVRRGLEWMAKKFSVKTNPSTVMIKNASVSRTWHFYYLYGVERIGRLTGQRFIGTHDWYREGAEYLVAKQDPLSSFWIGSGYAEDNPQIATSFALLFLSKGRRPIVISQLRHGTSKVRLGDEANDLGDWNHHRQGLHHLTQSIEVRWRRDLTWQTIDANVATVEDFLQTPVLFISGKDELRLANEQKEDLKRYVNQGGFIFAEAACGGLAFDKSFRKLMTEIFPDSQLRLLQQDHPVWFAEGQVNAKYVPHLYGVDACCRTSVVYCPSDLSCYWELANRNRKDDYPANVNDQIDAYLQIGQNVIAYATNRVLKDKLDTPVIGEIRHVEPLTRNMLVVPKLQHTGGSDDAPNALTNLLNHARDQVEMRIDSNRRMISPTDPALFDYPIVFLHGRRDFRFTTSQQKALSTFVKRGGVIMADAICASPQFVDALRREVAAVIPGSKLERIPINHKMFGAEFGGYDLSSVTLRDPKLRRESDPLGIRLIKGAPYLEGVQIDGR